MGKGESTRQQIVGRALELSTLIGLEGISIGVLAEDLKLSKSGLFAHFRSKEALQLAVIEHASERFTETIVRPTLAAPRGEPRLKAAFEHWHKWPETSNLPGGCFFVPAASELDDRPGVVRDALAQQVQGWLDIVAEIARGAVREGHFKANVDGQQFAFEMFGIILSYHQYLRLLSKPDASKRARAAFTALLARSRAEATDAAARDAAARPDKKKRATKLAH